MTGERQKVVLWRPRTALDWLDWCFGHGRYPRRDRARIVEDAERLIDEFGESGAYAAAQRLANADPPVVEHGLHLRHWSHVASALADHLQIRTGLHNYDRA